MGKNLSVVGTLTPLAVLILTAAAAGQERNQENISGSGTYRTYCAVCHGTSGRGDGKLARELRARPSDLTLIAKRNGGRYPHDKVRRLVDGRELMKGHGDDMPVWGDAFRNASDSTSEEKVKEKIDALVEYLKVIQEPTK